MFLLSIALRRYHCWGFVKPLRRCDCVLMLSESLVSCENKSVSCKGFCLLLAGRREHCWFVKQLRWCDCVPFVCGASASENKSGACRGLC